MASNPPGKCCSEGVVHSGTPVGEFKTINDVRTYFTYPENKTTHNAILILTDVIGVDNPNVQLIADSLAKNGYFVVIPDLFNGDAVPFGAFSSGEIDIPTWLAKHSTSVVDPIVESTLKEMRGPLGCKRIGGIGYCFGGKYVCRFLREGSLDAGYTAHPSFVLSEELGGIKGPLSIAAAEIDDIFTVPKRHESEEILSKTGQPWQIHLYSSVSHGFAVRADPNAPRREVFAKEQAFKQAVDWFEEYLMVGS